MPQAPQVLDGMRAPRSERMDDMRSVNANAPLPVPQTATAAGTGDATIYVSKFRGYMVQITAPRPGLDPATGRKFSTKPIVARFEDGVYRNGAPGTAGYRNPNVKALVDEALQSNPYFGAFGDAQAHFWLADDQKARMEAARIQSARDTLRSLPKEAIDEFVNSLRQGDAEDHNLSASANSDQ